MEVFFLSLAKIQILYYIGNQFIIKFYSFYDSSYIPELKKKDPLFDSLRIEHLLDMTAGLKFNENYGWNPFSKMARLYMGNDAMKVVEGMRFSDKPGERYHYDSMTSQLLGIVIER
ncbi:MAG: serine hydrolase [Bacteroidetes bacterium]|uniref:Serine hydrolase n=1 Tax=Candidatus Cryptobacteroides merdavium TaxID=2840769 RepID=A0A9D9HCT7_9BACT|nr:serine hydrolase [Candidatus Cryptobacteroides merdavium]